MNFGFKAQDVINQRREALEQQANKAREKRDAIKADIIASIGDPTVNLDNYIFYSDKYQHIMDEVRHGSTIIAEVYAKFSDMLRELSGLNAMVDGDKIVIKCMEGQSDFMLIMIAKYFGISSGMFTFRSSFTTHEAYLEDENGKDYWAFKIGHSRDDYDTLIIYTNLLTMPVINY